MMNIRPIYVVNGYFPGCLPDYQSGPYPNKDVARKVAREAAHDHAESYEDGYCEKVGDDTWDVSWGSWGSGFRYSVEGLDWHGLAPTRAEALEIDLLRV